MLRGTHVTLGIATALLATRPDTLPGIVAAMTGGALGGWIVDIDCKNTDVDREKVYDTIIDTLVIAAFIALDFFIGDGICHFIATNWSWPLWIALAGFIGLSVFGFTTKHRTFTHSLLGMALFCVAIYFFCKPMWIPFAIGYASHLVADFFNKLGLQLFYPLKWRPCLKVCRSDKRANKVLFRIALAIDFLAGGYLFAMVIMRTGGVSPFISKLNQPVLWGFNPLQLYLIGINIVTFIAFQISWRLSYREEYYNSDHDLAVQMDFETWLLNILVFAGGGAGMQLALISHLAYPNAENGNWWSFGYSSVLFWFTVYCAVCNPFGWTINTIDWLSPTHFVLYIYLLVINAISAAVFFAVRNRRFKNISLKHTALILLGAIGGTIGAIPVVVATRHEEKYSYAVIGFYTMMISQVFFIMYMMMVGIF